MTKITKIGDIYVEVRGDITQYQRDMRALRADAKASGTEISNALNNAISPTQASRGIASLSQNLTQLSNVAKTPGDSFKVTAAQMSRDLGDVAKKTGISEREFAKLNEKMLRTTAHKNAERSLQGIARAAGLSSNEAQKLARQMGFTDAEAKKLAKSMDGGAKSGKTWKNSISGVATALAGIYSIGKLGSMIKDTAMAAARYETLGVVMNVVGRNAGYTAQEMSGFEKSLQKSGIGMNESRTTLAKMAQAQINLAKSTDLARIAQDAAVIGNINSSDAFERMVTGIQTAQVEMLRTIGINVNFQDAYKKSAEQLGKNTDELTELEKTQARVNAVVEAGAGIAGAYEESMGTAGKQMLSMKRYLDDLKILIGQVFNPALTMIVFRVADSLKEVNSTLTESDSKIKNWGGNLLEIMRFVENGFLGIKLVGQTAILAVATAMSVLYEAMRKVLFGFDLMFKAAVKLGVISGNPLDGISNALSDIKDVSLDVTKSVLEDIQKTNDKYDAAKAAIWKVQESTKELGKAAVESAKKSTKEVEKLEKAYVDAAKGITGNWELMYRDRSDVQSRALDAEIWAEEQALESMGQAVDEFYGDIYDRGEDHVDDVTKLQEALVNDLGRIFDSYINDVLTGEIDSIEDLFKGLFDSVLDMFSRLLSQMAANSLIDALFGAGASGGLTLGSLFGGGTGGGGLLGGASAATSIGGIAAKVAGWLGIGGGAATALPIGVAAPTVGAGAVGGTAFLPGGAVPAGGGFGGLGFAPWMGPAAVAAIGVGLWAQSVFGEKKPTTTELMNQMGLVPDDFAFAIGQTFTEAMDPVYGVMQSHMATAGGQIVTTWDSLNDDIKKINTRLYNTTTGQWEDLRLTGGAIMAMMSGDIVSTIDAMAIEANYGIDGLAEHIINVSKEAQSTGDKVEDAFQDMGLSAGDLHRAMELAGRAMESASGSTNDLEKYLSDLGYTADDMSGALDILEGGMNKLINDGIDPLRDAFGKMGGDAKALSDVLSDALDEALKAEAPPPPPPAPDPQPPGFPDLLTPQVSVYLDGNDIINTGKLNARIVYIADKNRVKADRLGLSGKPMVYA